MADGFYCDEVPTELEYLKHETKMESLIHSLSYLEELANP